MQPSPNYYPALDSSNGDGNPFNVVIVYEDFETGKQAKRTFDFLVEHLKGQCHFNNQMWKFDVLNIPKLREMAAKDAALSDIVMISCHAKTELPAEVKAWIELWLAQNNHAIALVAMVDSAPGLTVDAITLKRYLADVATRGGMEFFAQPGEFVQTACSTQNSQSLPAHRITQPADLGIASLAQTVDRDSIFPRWGINE